MLVSLLILLDLDMLGMSGFEVVFVFDIDFCFVKVVMTV